MYHVRNHSYSPVIPNVKCVEALCEALHVIGADLLQEVYVVFRVEATHVMLRCFIRLEYLTRQTFEMIKQNPGSRVSSGMTVNCINFVTWTEQNNQ